MQELSAYECFEPDKTSENVTNLLDGICLILLLEYNLSIQRKYRPQGPT